jgi:hypothetical protein
MVRAWLALALVAGAGAYGLATARPAQAAQTVEVGLTSMNPAVATSSSGTLALSGQLTVPSGQKHEDVIVQLAFAEIQLRSEMDQSAETGPNEQQLFGVQDVLGDIGAGTHPWNLSASLADMGLSPDHVYALDVQVWSDGTSLLGVLRTYLPYKIGSGQSLAPTQLTVLAPVTAPVPLDGYSEPVSGASYQELTQDSLIQQMGESGSLYQLLAKSAQLPKGTVSWVVDPDLLSAAAQIAEGYVVAKPGASGDAVGPDTGNADDWLKEAKAVLAGPNSELWQLPSTDPDLGSLSHATPAEAQRLLSAAAAQSTTAGAVKTATGADPRGLLAFPADGQANAQTLKLAQSVDPTAVVVDSDSTGLSVPDDSYTPTGRASANGHNDLAVADSALDAIMDGDPADADYSGSGSNTTVLAGQRLLAQTALIGLEKPEQGRSVMLALPRSSATAAKDMGVLDYLRDAPWLKPAGLSALLQQTPDKAASTGSATRAASVSDTDLGSAQLNQVLALDSQLQLYQSILSSSAAAADGFTEAVLRTVSTGWRGQRSAWADFQSTVSSRLASQMGQVYLIPKSDLTLSGTSGSIPFTVVNHLPHSVNLGLDIDTNRTGLHVTQPPVRTFAPGSTTVEVKVTAEAPGANVVVTAYLVNSSGRHYGSATSGGSRSLQVTVTSIGFVALLLFAGSAALLVFAVGLRIYRGRRGSRRTPETQPGD